MLVRISEREHVGWLIDLLKLSMAPTTASWHLREGESEQEWVRVHTGPDGEPLDDLHTLLMERT